MRGTVNHRHRTPLRRTAVRAAGRRPGSVPTRRQPRISWRPQDLHLRLRTTAQRASGFDPRSTRDHLAAAQPTQEQIRSVVDANPPDDMLPLQRRTWCDVAVRAGTKNALNNWLLWSAAEGLPKDRLQLAELHMSDQNPQKAAPCPGPARYQSRASTETGGGPSQNTSRKTWQPPESC